MSTKVNKFATVETTLTAAVTDSSTFAVGYPTGSSQLSFNAGLAGTGSYMIVDNNDKYTVAASQMSISYDASEITITNSTGLTLAAGTKIVLFLDKADAGPVSTLAFPISLSGVTAADVVTEFRPGIDGVIENAQFVVDVPVTTASKAATLNLEVDTTNVTGGTVALTSANCTPKGAVVAGAAITAGNTITRESKLSVEAASVTAFAEGSGTLYVTIRQTLPDAY